MDAQLLATHREADLDAYRRLVRAAMALPQAE
jgi:hypothetical protein